MQRFFSSMAVIEKFIASLNCTSHRHKCPICHQSDQWVSHGFLCKQSGEIVGKRILCGKRYGKSGCGHTQPLYLDDVLPQRRYKLSVLLAFVLALVKGATVEQAYCQAVGHHHNSPRQAWRWLNGLWSNMGEFRSRLPLSESGQTSISGGSRRLTLLLNTLHQCLAQLYQPEAVQGAMQSRFC